MHKERIAETLTYPPKNAVKIIYKFLLNQNNGKKQEGWIYDFGTAQFKCPMKRFSSNPFFWRGTKTNGETNTVEGTNICWKVESDMFVFWIKEE